MTKVRKLQNSTKQRRTWPRWLLKCGLAQKPSLGNKERHSMRRNGVTSSDGDNLIVRTVYEISLFPAANLSGIVPSPGQIIDTEVPILHDLGESLTAEVDGHKHLVVPLSTPISVATTHLECVLDGNRQFMPITAQSLIQEIAHRIRVT